MCPAHGPSYRADSLANSPGHSAAFSLVIMRYSQTEGTRLLGSIEIGRDELLGEGGNHC
jgi:hypothetical protein